MGVPGRIAARLQGALEGRELRIAGHIVSRLLSAALAALALVAALPASAQVQRSFINLGFEEPALVTAGCRVYIAASQVNGWNTTHTPHATEC